MAEEDNVLQQWEPKVHQFLKGATRSLADTEDLAQELRIAILRAYRKFDATRGVSFHTYLHVAMDNTRKYFWWRNYHMPIRQTQELTELSKIENHAFDELPTDILERLNSTELFIAQQLNDGFKLSEIRRMLQIPRKDLYDILDSLRQKVKLTLQTRMNS